MPGAPASGRPSRQAHVARLAHDLHGPLTVIRGLCATLARTEERPDHRRALALIDGEALRLAEGLRALVRTDGEGGPGPLPADLAALTISIAERFGPAAVRAGVRLAVRGVHRPVWVEGDLGAIERAVENLVGNALRHAGPDGLVELALATRGGRAVLRVRDDGAGVAVADRERIFRPGERGGAPRGEGRGLGLAIAREIAEAHGGRLTLDPVGTGACFRLSLPLGPAAGAGPRAA